MNVPQAFRRVVTALRQNGKSYVAADAPVALDTTAHSTRFVRAWVTGPGVGRDDSAETNDSVPVPLQPLPLGTKSGFLILYPEATPKSFEELEREQAELYAELGASDCRIPGSRHPAMHVTQTIDYIFVVSGTLTMLLDETEVELQPFDVVVQRGTNHAWINRGTTPAVLSYVMVDLASTQTNEGVQPRRRRWL
jgi:mannose-6-phosphate isomerase-like protein (cupin superfamily)